jgi:hypothetical protein
LSFGPAVHMAKRGAGFSAQDEVERLLKEAGS